MCFHHWSTINFNSRIKDYKIPLKYFSMEFQVNKSSEEACKAYTLGIKKITTWIFDRLQIFVIQGLFNKVTKVSSSLTNTKVPIKIGENIMEKMNFKPLSQNSPIFFAPIFVRKVVEIKVWKVLMRSSSTCSTQQFLMLRKIYPNISFSFERNIMRKLLFRQQILFFKN